MVTIIYYILFFFVLSYGLYFFLTGLYGFKKMRTNLISEHSPKYKFAILIPARNECEVISYLVKSLVEQRYPNKLFDIYVLPNNCTDNTKEVALEAGAKVIDITVKTKSKGEVLNFAFDSLKLDNSIDAYVIFDADNIVHPDYLSKMNNALCEGHEVGQCFRDSKNPNDNWISGSYSIFYWLQNFFFNKSRMQLGGSASINGTGFMVKKEIIDEYGFNTVTLTEDVEFTAQCALNNIKIVFVEEAKTYDEQPIKFNESWKQRKRWSIGNHQCLKVYSKDLFRTFFKTGFLPCFDMLFTFLAPSVQVLTTLLSLALISFPLFGIRLNDIFSLMFAYAYGVVFLSVCYIFGIILNIFIIKYNNKSLKDMTSSILLFSFFMVTWIPINFISIIKKDMEWEQIKHNKKVDFNDL